MTHLIFDILNAGQCALFIWMAKWEKYRHVRQTGHLSKTMYVNGHLHVIGCAECSFVALEVLCYLPREQWQSHAVCVSNQRWPSLWPLWH